MFGEEVGALLYNQARREESFVNNNILDAQHMAPLDSPLFTTKDVQREARLNSRSIKSNIPKLVRIFMRNR